MGFEDEEQKRQSNYSFKKYKEIR